ncbi:MAG: hypothetical protein RSC76_08920 [Oscillospiraceae bacterium]
MTTWKIDTSELDALIRAFSTEQRGQLHLASARAVASLCRRHLRQIAQTRHASANRLGATPTRHFEHANVFAEASADDAHVHIKLPGLARAFVPITITPAPKKSSSTPSNRAKSTNTRLNVGKFASSMEHKLRFSPSNGMVACSSRISQKNGKNN